MDMSYGQQVRVRSQNEDQCTLPSLDLAGKRRATAPRAEEDPASALGLLAPGPGAKHSPRSEEPAVLTTSRDSPPRQLSQQLPGWGPPGQFWADQSLLASLVLEELPLWETPAFLLVEDRWVIPTPFGGWSITLRQAGLLCVGLAGSFACWESLAAWFPPASSWGLIIRLVLAGWLLLGAVVVGWVCPLGRPLEEWAGVLWRFWRGPHCLVWSPHWEEAAASLLEVSSTETEAAAEELTGQQGCGRPPRQGPAPYGAGAVRGPDPKRQRSEEEARPWSASPWSW